jgi:hypothetical protein
MGTLPATPCTIFGRIWRNDRMRGHSQSTGAVYGRAQMPPP